MNDKLKKFVSEHKQEFDSMEPSKDLWKKIDAQIDVKKHSRISSKWLSKLVYLGFSASILVIAIYFITMNLNSSSPNDLTMNRKDSVNNPERYLEANHSKPELNTTDNNTTKGVNELSNQENGYQNSTRASLENRNEDIRSTQDSSVNIQETFNQPLSSEAEKLNTNSVNEKKENKIARSSKKIEIYIPEEPEKMNMYTGTLYEGSSLCSLLQVYKFPGKTRGLDHNFRQAEYKIIMKTLSCGRFERMPNIKAVWIKGRTDKNIKLSLKKGFKNIVLIKSDGRKLNPEAVSHYYPGRMVISNYTGKGFNMVFTNKVELILLFKDAEEGDKILIDDTFEAVVKNQP